MSPELIGIILACLSLFLNYIIGKPGGEFSPYEIFSGYTVWLSERRLRAIGNLETYVKLHNESLLNAGNRATAIEIEIDFKRIVYQAAEPFFTWERAVGMCAVCTGFWISLVGGTAYLLYSKENFFNLLIQLIIIIVISHVTIRILSKIIL